ncbi:hypothetical protein pv_238 [Pithovirus sibericum]|uniref:Uncharacterized protein n=1 Tax=Pithovirus sibericum TaxID=1450746 RepID=W5SAK8_9VIRU|nr:hypothetical protein pv_238 [Pithovirus sibericum]AHH01805.1 hypothetical protein pv_238 [Pithovirus sibericum]
MQIDSFLSCFNEKWTYAEVEKFYHQNPKIFENQEWEFWKIKAEKQFSVPSWYFNLPLMQKRKVEGKTRFLEIASKFRLIPESVGIQSIYPMSISQELAVKQGNVEIFDKLFVGCSSEVIDNFRSQTLLNSQLRRFGFSSLELALIQTPNCLAIFLKHFKVDNKCPDLNLFYDKICSSPSPSWVTTRVACLDNEEKLLYLAILMANGDLRPSIIKLYRCLNLHQMSEILIFSLSCDFDPRRFLKMSEFFGVDRTSCFVMMLKKAFFQAHRFAITHLQKYCSMTLDEKLTLLSEGYLFNPHPVQVYKIISMIFESLPHSETLNVLAEPLKKEKMFRIDVDLYLSAKQFAPFGNFLQFEPNSTTTNIEYLIEEFGELTEENRPKIWSRSFEARHPNMIL